MRKTSPLLVRRGTDLLRRIQALGLFTDASLCAHLAELGCEVDRTTLVRYRKGERTAPIGLLEAMLDHAGPEGAREILSLLCRERGLSIAHEAPAHDGIVLELLQDREAGGRVSARVAAALADGKITHDELDGIEAELEHELREITQTRQAVRDRRDSLPRIVGNR